MAGLVTIIPGLVSLETGLDRLRSFALAPGFSSFQAPESPLDFHFKLIKRRLKPAGRELLRSGWVSWTGESYVYRRPFPLGELGFEARGREVSISPGLLRLPFSLGGIKTAGELFFGQVTWELFKAGFLVLRGCAWQDGAGRVRAVVMPGMNGKTSLLVDVLSRDPEALLIAEDLLVLRPLKSGFELYPTAPFFRNQGREPNRRLKKFADRLARNGPLVGTRLDFATNSRGGGVFRAAKALDFALTNGLFFLHDPLVQLEILARGGFDELLGIIKDSFLSVEGLVLAGCEYNLLEILPDP